MNRKKYFRIIISMLIMALVCTSLSWAQDAGQEEEKWELKGSGMTFTVPEEYRSAHGFIGYSGGGELIQGSGIFLTAFVYLAMTEEDYMELIAKENPSQEEQEAFYDSMLNLAEIFVLDQGRDKSALSMLFDDPEAIENMTELAKAGEYTFYLHQPEPEDKSSLGEFWDEFQEFYAKPELITDHLEYFEPKDPSAMEGQISFETEDIFGNPVVSSDLFGEYKVTMINIWTSWCTYCIKEMPELEEMYQKYKEEGGMLIGLLYDANEPGAVEDALEIMEDTGVTYPVVLPWDGYERMFPVQAFPTTVFVDREGNIVGSTVVGADIARYEEVMNEVLESVKE